MKVYSIKTSSLPDLLTNDLSGVRMVDFSTKKVKKVNQDWWWPNLANLDADSSLKLHGYYFGFNEWLIDIDFNFGTITTHDKNKDFLKLLDAAIFLSKWIKSGIRDEKLNQIGL